ncbi:MAG TPA: acetamidase/formamidase family protein [Micromonosporaceae bacterium]|nr:acetamidase/formamidase family protein [Micromonosporaceae bacterium]
MSTPQLDYTPAKHELAYTFGGRTPVARINPRQPFRVSTEDCFGGAVRTVDDLPSQVCQFPYLNPVSGPFYVAGAQPGHTLAIHLIDITPARDWAMSATFPHFGALTSTHTTATLQPPLQEQVWRYDLDTAAGTVRYASRQPPRGARYPYQVDLPLDPMLGTIGVAPAAGEVRMTIVPDTHGGNLDTPHLRAGATLYLGVNVEGAMLSLGDGHARQGDGEACGVAVEAAMHTVLVVHLIKDTLTPWPRIESDQRLMSVGLARPLEDAYRISQHDLVGWVADLTALDTLDAYQLVAQAGQAPVGNVCDANYTMLATIDKTYVRGRTPYRGVHDELRTIGAAHRSPQGGI